MIDHGIVTEGEKREETVCEQIILNKIASITICTGIYEGIIIDLSCFLFSFSSLLFSLLFLFLFVFFLLPLLPLFFFCLLLKLGVDFLTPIKC